MFNTLLPFSLTVANQSRTSTNTYGCSRLAPTKLFSMALQEVQKVFQGLCEDGKDTVEVLVGLEMKGILCLFGPRVWGIMLDGSYNPSLPPPFSFHQLIEAGFSLSATKGQPDRCCCYLCGATCSDWAADHDPFLRHAAASPRCALVILHKSKLVAAKNNADNDEAPWSKSVLHARIRTFTNAWPHSDSISVEKVGGLVRRVDLCYI